MTNPPTASSIPLPQPINLAVLPFAVAGTTGDRQYFGEGLTESLTEQLAKLLVTNRNVQVASVMDRRARQVTNPVEAREQLGANLALSGLLQYDGPDVRVSAVLFDTRSGRRLRQDTFTPAVSDAPAIQAGALDMVVRMLGVPLDPQQRALLTVRATIQPDAYDYYLRARGYLLDYDRIESIDAAIKVFRSALAIDSSYAPAYAGLGQAYWRMHDLTGAAGWTDFAREACETALRIDRGLAESHVCLGMVLNGTGEYERAGAAYSLALEREPTNDQAYIGLATAYERLGRQADAEETYRRAIRLRPHYWGGYNNLGAYYYRSARYQEALTAFAQVVDLAPDSFRGHSSVGAVEFMLEHTDEAIAAFMKSLDIRPNYVAASNLATLYYFEGQFRLAADYFNQALKLERGSYQVWNNLAEALEQLDRHDDALDAFRQTRLLAMERLQVNPNDAEIQVLVADASAALGEMDRARQALSAALRLAPTEAHTLFLIGVFYEARLNDRVEALKWLAKAIEHGQTWREIDKQPALRRLREDPRFQQLRHPN
jgi:serine/threonine-protein kinase